MCGRHTDVVEVERGVYGSLPYAAVGGGPPLVVFAGLMPVTGVGGGGVVSSALHPLLPDRPRSSSLVATCISSAAAATSR
jgi:hypothetical protein